MDKVKFGLKNVHIHPIESIDENGLPVYDEPFAIPGAVNVKFDKDGDVKPFYADNIKYFVTVSNNGYSGDLEVAVITDEFRIKILGYVKDDNGVLVENSSVQPKSFAMTYEEEGDTDGTKFCLYNGTATRPSLNSKTTEDSKDPTTQTINVSFAPLKNGKVLAMSTEDTDASVVANWHDEPYLGSALPSM